MSKTCLVYCSCPPEQAEPLARALVQERLAACASILPGARSVYHWQGEVHADDEALLMIKTTTACLPGLRERVPELHPYELPELIAVPITDGLPGYLDWIKTHVAR